MSKAVKFARPRNKLRSAYSAKAMSHSVLTCQRNPRSCAQNVHTRKNLTNRVLKSMSKKELLKVESLNPLKVGKFLAKLAGRSLQDKYARDVAINNLEERIDAFGV